MNLHQIQATYQPHEDRILLRVSFKAETGALHEIRSWLTRRLVKNLWAGLLSAMETQVTLDQPQAAHASAEIIGLQHEACISAMKKSGNFGNNYESAIQGYPMGEAAMLVTAANLKVAPGQPIRINFSVAEGNNFEIAFTQPILHGFCTLLGQAAKNAQWDMTLEMPGMAVPGNIPSVLN